MIFTIAVRELRSTFLSPLAWILIGVIQIILGLITSARFEDYIKRIQPQQDKYQIAEGVTAFLIQPQYIWLAVIMLFATPILTMRIFSDERRNRTLTLLYSAPITMTEIALGKYLGLLALLLIMLATFTIMPLSILFFSRIDFGLLASYLLGTYLFMASIGAIGFYASSLTENPIIAAILAFFVMLLISVTIFLPADSPEKFSTAELSPFVHLLNFNSGSFGSQDLFYFIILVTVFLVLTIHRLDRDRLQN